jgi:hypothetical protein
MVTSAKYYCEWNLKKNACIENLKKCLIGGLGSEVGSHVSDTVSGI